MTGDDAALRRARRTGRTPRTGRATRVAPLVLLALVPFIGALAAGLLRVEGCVPAPGAIGWAGLHLALVHPSTACPAGTAAVGGSPGHTLALVVTLALPALAAHVAALAVVVGAAGVLRALRDTLAALTCRRVRPALPSRPAARRLPLPAREPLVLRHAWLSGVLDRRGPPAPVVA